MNLQTFQKQIKQQTLSSSYAITGTEEALIDKYLSLFKQLIPSDEQDMNLGTLDLAHNEIDELIAEWESLPFFGDHKVIIAQNAQLLTKKKITDKQQNQLTRLLTNPSDTVVMVFVLGDEKLDKRKKLTQLLLKSVEILDAQPLNEGQIKQAITQLLAKRDYQINNDALLALIHRTNASYSRILNELPKLTLYARKTRLIEVDAVNGLVAETLHAGIFDLVDQVLTNQVEAAMLTYRNLLIQGEEPIKINGAMLSQFKLLLQVAGQKGNADHISKVLSVHGYRVKLAQDKLRHYRITQLRDGYLGVFEMELALKTTTQDADQLFEQFVLNFSNQLNQR